MMKFAEEAYTFSPYEVLNSLKSQGYSEDFNNSHCCQEFLNNPHDFKIDMTFRFDNMSDPEDQSVLYAISSRNSEVKGVLINGYGIYNDPQATKILDSLDPDSDYNKERSYRQLTTESLKPYHHS